MSTDVDNWGGGALAGRIARTCGFGRREYAEGVRQYSLQYLRSKIEVELTAPPPRLPGWAPGQLADSVRSECIYNDANKILYKHVLTYTWEYGKKIRVHTVPLFGLVHSGSPCRRRVVGEWSCGRAGGCGGDGFGKLHLV